MSLRFSKPIDPVAVKEKLRTSIEWSKKAQEAYQIIVAALFPKWEGKSITKRAFNDANAALEAKGFKAYYVAQYGMYNIKVSYTQPQENTFSFLLGYFDGEGSYLKEAKFADTNCGYDNHDNVIEKMQVGVSKVDSLIKRWNQKVKELQDLQKEAADYNLEYTFDIRDR